MSRIRFLALATLVCNAVLAQDSVSTVGAAGDWRLAEWRGVQTFAPGTVERALRLLPGADDVSHPQAPRGPFLRWLRERTRRGYEYAGFGEATVTADVAEDGHLIVTVEEGPRVRAGELRVSGDGLTVDDVRGLLATTSKRRAPWWQEGGPGRLGEFAIAEVERRLTDALRDRGMIASQIDVAIDGIFVSGCAADRAGVTHGLRRPAYSAWARFAP